MQPRLSVIIVTHNNRDDLATTLPPLEAQLGAQDELILVDSGSSDGTIEAARELSSRATLMPQSDNVGFAAGCNIGAAQAKGELLLFLNPDVKIADDFCQTIRLPLGEHPNWGCWMGMVTMDAGERINTSGGVIHFTGIAWAGQAGELMSAADPNDHPIGFASGACLAVPRDIWKNHEGFPEHYFMYCEDVDLSLRIWLADLVVGIEPRARVDHSYSFEKGKTKWRLLERNRWSTLIRTYPAALLALLAPALLATELALVLVSFASGWGEEKLKAYSEIVAKLPKLIRERRVIQANRRISAAQFARCLTPTLDSMFLGAAGQNPLLRIALRLYWGLVCTILAFWSR